MLGLVLEVMVLVVGLESLQVVSLLGILPLVLNTGMRGVVALSWRGGTVHGFPFVVLVLLQLERDGSLIVVIMVWRMVGARDVDSSFMYSTSSSSSSEDEGDRRKSRKSSKNLSGLSCFAIDGFCTMALSSDSKKST
jgi:hypothetical protein